MKERQDIADRERVKYLLIFYGLRKKRKLERPLYLVQTINKFINDTLNIQANWFNVQILYYIIGFYFAI